MDGGDGRTPAELLRFARDRSETPELRWDAVHALAVADPELLLELTGLIFDEDEPELVRSVVALSLEYADDPRAVAALRRGLAGGVPELIRCLCASALGFHPSREATGDLVAILLDADEPSEVRGHAAEALAHTFQRQHYRQRPVPADVARAVRASVTDPDDVVRYEAVWALSQIGGVRDIALLERVLAAERARESPSVKIIEEALMAIDDLSTRRRPRRA
jgi:HEAT repeat protein